MSLPSLFVIGDSISCYYGKHLEAMLAGKFLYNRKGGTHVLKDVNDGTDGVNGGDSQMVLTYLKAVTEQDSFNPNFLLLNCGLHDTKPVGDLLQVPLERYVDNLEAILGMAKKRAIKVVWVNTTPVNERSTHWPIAEMERRKRAVEQYNQAATRIMTAKQIPIIALHHFTQNLGPEIYLNGDDAVHFDDITASRQAAFIAGVLWRL